MKVKTKIILTLVFGGAWAAATVVGGRALFRYETTAGRVGSLPRSWPADSAIQLAKDRPTLLMIAHPQCPCTRASVNELAELMARVQGKVCAYVLFFTPQVATADWENSRLRQNAAKIPGVSVVSDIDGVEAHRFGAETSGHTFLFDSSGHLLFNGGITASRGHSGANAGEAALVSLINHQSVGRTQTLVFGCSLANRPPTEEQCSR